MILVLFTTLTLVFDITSLWIHSQEDRKHSLKFLCVCVHAQENQVQVIVAEMPVWREDLAETDSRIHQTVRRQTSGGSTISLVPETADMTPTGESGQVKQSVQSCLINSS